MAIKHEMLRCFEAVVRLGSLIEAAEVLGRTPSAISMMLKKFEEHVGSPLFETARKSKLTPFGEAIYFEATRELANFDRTIDTIHSLAQGSEGSLRLAVIPSVSTNVMPGLIKTFVQSHPNVKIDVRDMDSLSVQRELETDRADIGIASTPEIAGLQRRILFSDEFGVVCSEDHSLALKSGDLTWENITSSNFISNGLCRLIEDEAFKPILAASRVSVPNTVSLLALVKAKVGITLLPRQAIPSEMRGLKFLPIIDCVTKRNVYVTSKAGRILLPAVRAFLVNIENEYLGLADA